MRREPLAAPGVFLLAGWGPSACGQASDTSVAGDAGADAEEAVECGLHGIAMDGASEASARASCLDSTGPIAPEFRTCCSDEDCTMVTIAACCGGADVKGIAVGALCSVAQSACPPGLTCPIGGGVTTDDGQSTIAGNVRVACTLGICRTTSADGG